MFILKEAVDLCEIMLKHIKVGNLSGCIVKISDDEKEIESLTLFKMLEAINIENEEIYSSNGLKVTWDIYLLDLLKYMCSKNLLNTVRIKTEEHEENLGIEITLNIVNIIELKKAITEGYIKVLN